MSGLTAKLSHAFSNLRCTDFRRSPFLVSEATESGLLIFTTLTCALLHIDGVYSANDLCEKAKRDDELRKALLLNRVLIPQGFDEQKFCEQLRTLLLNEKNGSFTAERVITLSSPPPPATPGAITALSTAMLPSP